MARLLFVGQAPAADTVGQPAFSGKCGQLLAQLMGISQEEMLKAHEFVNLLDFYPGKSKFGKGDNFPLAQAKARAEELRERFRSRAVVLLGYNVARAFGTLQFNYCQWYSLFDNRAQRTIPGVVSIVPHPSGINRWYNSADHRLLVQRFLRAAAESKDI